LNQHPETGRCGCGHGAPSVWAKPRPATNAVASFFYSSAWDSPFGKKNARYGPRMSPVEISLRMVFYPLGSRSRHEGGSGCGLGHTNILRVRSVCVRDSPPCYSKDARLLGGVNHPEREYGVWVMVTDSIAMNQ